MAPIGMTSVNLLCDYFNIVGYLYVSPPTRWDYLIYITHKSFKLEIPCKQLGGMYMAVIYIYILMIAL